MKIQAKVEDIRMAVVNKKYLRTENTLGRANRWTASNILLERSEHSENPMEGLIRAFIETGWTTLFLDTEMISMLGNIFS